MEHIHLATLHSLASRASIIMDVVIAVSSLLPAYQTSYSYMESVFLHFVEQAGRLVFRQKDQTSVTKLFLVPTVDSKVKWLCRR